MEVFSIDSWSSIAAGNCGVATLVSLNPLWTIRLNSSPFTPFLPFHYALRFRKCTIHKLFININS